MKTIKDNGVVYTQNAELPIEERVFFRQAMGMNADDEHFRPATKEEIAEHEAWLIEEEKRLNELNYE